MDNPWLNMPKTSPYWLGDDAPHILQFNSKVMRRKASELYTIRPEVPPEPFVGSPHAKVVLLGGNPGYNEMDQEFLESKQVATFYMKNLLHEEQEYPFYHLNPNIPNRCGRLWWGHKLRHLLREVDPKTLSRNLLCVEFFPYHSVKFRGGISVPSQLYGFNLVEEAMREKRLIVIMRKQEAWYDAAPGLADYENHYVLRNWQRVSISPGNLPDGYSRVVSTLKAALLKY